MRRIVLLGVLLAGLAGCGSPVPAPATQPTSTGPSGLLARRCVHYHYVVGADGRRHRQPCPAPAPQPQPAPAPGPPSPGPTPGPGGFGSALGPVAKGPGLGCGVERWATKTLQDPLAGSVNATPRVTTVAALASLAGQQPAPASPDAARQGVERQVWEITVTLDQAKVEGDGDFHVVAHDATARTIFEFPAAVCITGASRAAQAAINSARDTFVARFGQPQPDAFTALHGTVTLDGVGFEDRDHKQTGRDQLANGADIELHPVVAVK